MTLITKNAKLWLLAALGLMVIASAGVRAEVALQVPDMPTGWGTAFFVSSNGYMLTCDHVVYGAKRLEVLIDTKWVAATILAEDTKLDIALLKIDTVGIPIPLGDSGSVELGEEVSVAGFPLGEALGLNVKVSSGTVSGITSQDSLRILQIDAAVNPGNSGGPLINARGEVVGIVNAKIVRKDVSSIGFSIPINYVQSMLDGDGVSPLRSARVPPSLTTIERARRAQLSTRLVRAYTPEGAGYEDGDNITRFPKNGGTTAKKHFNPTDGAYVVFVPAGEFIMGDDADRTLKAINPHHKVMMSGYWIYQKLVSVRMYQKFCTATGRAMPSSPEFNASWSRLDHPMVNVSWSDAKAYCDWAGGDLPTSAQWEKAARGPNGLRYPWGNQYDPTKLWASSVVRGTAGGTAEGGGLAMSPYGCGDMAGNVDQWCRDWFDDGYWTRHTSELTDPNNQSEGEKRYRIMRGGSWEDFKPSMFLSAQCYWNVPNYIANYCGFRCVYTPK